MAQAATALNQEVTKLRGSAAWIGHAPEQGQRSNVNVLPAFRRKGITPDRS